MEVLAVLIIQVLSLVVASFVATNIDNLVLLVGWLLIKDLEVSQILIGYLLGMLFLLLLSIAIGFASMSLPISSFL